MDRLFGPCRLAPNRLRRCSLGCCSSSRRCPSVAPSTCECSSAVDCTAGGFPPLGTSTAVVMIWSTSTFDGCCLVHGSAEIWRVRLSPGRDRLLLSPKSRESSAPSRFHSPGGRSEVLCHVDVRSARAAPATCRDALLHCVCRRWVSVRRTAPLAMRPARLRRSMDPLLPSDWDARQDLGLSLPSWEVRRGGVGGGAHALLSESVPTAVRGERTWNATDYTALRTPGCIVVPSGFAYGRRCPCLRKDAVRMSDHVRVVQLGMAQQRSQRTGVLHRLKGRSDRLPCSLLLAGCTWTS